MRLDRIVCATAYPDLLFKTIACNSRNSRKQSKMYIQKLSTLI